MCPNPVQYILSICICSIYFSLESVTTCEQEDALWMRVVDAVYLLNYNTFFEWGRTDRDRVYYESYILNVNCT